MFHVMYSISRFYLSRPVDIGDGNAFSWLKSRKDYTVVTSKTPLNIIENAIKGFEEKMAGKIILSPPIEINELNSLINEQEINTSWIVGIGGGRINDVSKYLAKNLKKKLCLIPSILSTTSWLNMGVALRQDNVLTFPCNRHPDKIIVDLNLISKATPDLNVAGIADLTCSASAIGDWKISSELKGEKISKKAINKFIQYNDEITAHPEFLSPVSKDTIRYIHDKFLEGLSLCGASFSGRPLEGSEHFMYYYLDELDDRKFRHGSMIAMTTLISLKLQGERALYSLEKLKTFFTRAGIDYSPEKNHVSEKELVDMLKNIKHFVEKRGYPFSILNIVDEDMDGKKANEIIKEALS
ncbi:MAG: iron-containing alcohol dehydrogenase [Promethearchaeota archaeon]